MACGRSSRACPIIRCWPGLDVGEPARLARRGDDLAAALELHDRPAYPTTPVVKWCGIDVPRVWRCGNRGNVASVLIEKPAKGDFLPILDGGYSLQYSPLMEYREGKGLVLFCQMDVTGRTESDPAAETLARNICRVRVGLEACPAAVRRSTPASRRQAALESAGIPVGSYEGGELVGRPGACRRTRRREKTPPARAAASPTCMKAGGHVLAIGLDEEEANAVPAVQGAT